MAALPSQRHRFDIPESVAYLNCAYNSPQLDCARDSMLVAARSKSHPWERRAEDFFADADRIRELAARAFGGEADGWAVVPAASYAMSTAARAVEPTLGKGDRIVVIAEEFPSNVLPWRRTASVTGAEVTTVSPGSDGDFTRSVLSALDRTVKVVSVSPCHWTDGTRIDCVAIGQACRSLGATFVLDATQAMGAVPLDFDAIRPDFLGCSGYKWLLCPYGFGLLYVGKSWREARPLEETWLGRLGAEDFAGLVNYVDAYRPGARRFDVGETCAPTILSGAIAALECVGTWTVAAIDESLALMTQRIVAGLEPLGFRFPESNLRSHHIIGATVPEPLEASALVARLREAQIYVSQRGRALRISPHVHVTDRDLDRLFEEATHACKR
ncbi:MAG: aminotransferase class V-fold PLP-dependent enzyme [Polyangiaceae bacterium]